MFSYIRGKLVEKSDGFVVVDVNGVGFKIFTSQNSLADSKCVNGEEITFHTYLYIKEGIMDLYGFTARQELDLFLMLISVNGVGAKGAISILSVAPCEKLCLAIATDDTATIKKASGIGAKTAQRVCLELKDKIKNESFISGNTDAFADVVPLASDDNASEAVNALIALGYSAQEAHKAVKGAKGDSVEDIIKAALKAMM